MGVRAQSVGQSQTLKARLTETVKIPKFREVVEEKRTKKV